MPGAGPRGGDGPGTWRALAEPACEPLLSALRGIDAPPEPAAIERLRRSFPPEAVAAAIELSIARTRAVPKFGEAAAGLWCDRPGLEMASSPRVARHKAMRFAAAGATAIDDLCCGIGGDLMELAKVAEATGVDLDPVRAWMAARNSGAPTVCADALGFRARGDFAHADPARRTADGARVRGPARLEPPLEALRTALAGRRGFAVKLGPGMDLEAPLLQETDELEFISEEGRLVQQVLWSGSPCAAPGARTATMACSGLSIHGAPTAPPVGDGRVRRHLFVPDPALERARLLGAVSGALGACEPVAGLGILTADDAAEQAAERRWFEAFEVLEELPAREHAVAAWLAARGAGIVTVRTRGAACDPDRWQASLRGPGDTPWTVFVLRLGSRRVAYAVRRLGSR